MEKANIKRKPNPHKSKSRNKSGKIQKFHACSSYQPRKPNEVFIKT